jgi:Uri superfamily endonuclease
MPAALEERHQLTVAPGTYALVLHCARPARVHVGRLGVLRAQPGYYVYAGSALGPGGVRARVGHHERTAPRPRWHIDYLRARATPIEAWWVQSRRRREHAWALIVSSLPGAEAPLAGFGSSDCACATHLYAFEERPSFAAFRARLSAAKPVVQRTTFESGLE